MQWDHKYLHCSHCITDSTDGFVPGTSSLRLRSNNLMMKKEHRRHRMLQKHRAMIATPFLSLVLVGVTILVVILLYSLSSIVLLSSIYKFADAV